jgi:hypothetical protein
MRLLKGICGLTAAALVASSAAAQDRPDILDIHLGTFYTAMYTMTQMGVVTDNGKGKPFAGAANVLGDAYVDRGYVFLGNTIAGTVPVTANGGTTINLSWFFNEFDKAQRSSKSVKIDQKTELAWSARILTAMGATASTTMGADLEWESPNTDGMGNLVAGGVDDCSAKVQAKGTAQAISGAQSPLQPSVPDSAKWQAKCKQTTYGALLTAIGVPAANATTILQGLGVAATDKVSIKGGS